jgi:tripartite ATP-independent transporter DctM subunit
MKQMRIGLIALGIVVAAILLMFFSVENITRGHLGLLMLALIVVAIMLGFPTAFTLMGLGMAFGAYAYFRPDQPITQNPIFDLMVQKAYGVMTNDVLISVPLFVFMGYIIERANIIDRLFRSLRFALVHVPGSLAVATIVTCAIFATATGIIGAVVTLMGLLAFPAMLRAKYDVQLSAGAITAGGTLGILIPPSVLLILYGATASVSVVKLYAGAFLPGVGLALLYVLYVIVRAGVNPKLAPKLPPEETAGVTMFQVLLMLLKSCLPLGLLIACVLGSILFGLATPTMAAALGSLGGLVLALAYRQLTFQRLKESVFLTARTTAMVCWLFVGSAIFSATFALLGGQELVEKWVLGLGLSPLQFLLLSQIIIFLLGWPLEWTEIIVIFMPIFLPLLDNFHIDPLFFGLLVALNLQTAFLSPPVAMAAFYLKGVSPPQVTLGQIFSGMMPFMGLQVVMMGLLYLFPQIGLWLPSIVYR